MVVGFATNHGVLRKGCQGVSDQKDAFFSSCRSDAPRKTVLQQISSEAKEIKGVSKDEIQGPLQIFDNQNKEGWQTSRYLKKRKSHPTIRNYLC